MFNLQQAHKKLIHFVCVILVFYFTGSCSRQTEQLKASSYKDYFPISVSKYIIYRLDSTITKNFGTGFEIHSCIVKDSVEEQLVDNENRLTYKVVRYQLINNLWKPVNTFMTTPLSNRLEYIENNLRIIKLINPVTENISWKGNSYCNQNPFYINSDFVDWTYRYNNIAQPYSNGDLNQDSTLTVVSYDSLNNKPFYYKQYSTYTKAYEVYAKNIGKVYQDILTWEYQVFTGYFNCKHIYCSGNKCDTSSIDCEHMNCDSIRQIKGHTINCDTLVTRFYYDGFGVKMTMIEHN